MESSTIAALLSYSSTARQSNIQEILPKFSSPLKNNFENRSLWLRFGLTLSLSHESPRSAIQAFNECLRIDQYDPLPAMLAAKLMLERLDDPDDGLEMAKEAIERCQRLADPVVLANGDQGNNHRIIVDGMMSDNNNTNHIHNHHHEPNKHVDKSTNGIGISSKCTNSSSSSSSHYLEAKCCYKNVAPLLSKCYLLASIMHAHIYEREPESIRQFKTSNLNASLYYLDMASKTYSNNYLVYFHKALHEARQRSFPEAVDNLRQAIKLNPYHVPSMQLLILSLSALKLYDDALILCESALHEFEDNLLLLYIKCNLEQCLVETKGYKSALATAQQMLKCIRSKTDAANKSTETKIQLPESTKSITTTEIKQQTTNLFADDNFDARHRQNCISGELSVWLLVAEIFVKIGSIKDAELCLDEGSTHTNGALSHQIMFVRGLIAKAKNNLIESKSFFQSCLALCPRHAKALQQVAHVHYLLGNYSTAEKFLKDSLDVDGDCFKTWHYLSLVFIETNQHEKASECAKKATSLENSSPIVSISAITRLILE